MPTGYKSYRQLIDKISVDFSLTSLEVAVATEVSVCVRVCICMCVCVSSADVWAAEANEMPQIRLIKWQATSWERKSDSASAGVKESDERASETGSQTVVSPSLRLPQP